LSPTLDTVGPMARCAEDLAALWSVMAGPNAGTASASRSGSPWRIGMLDALYGGAEPERDVSDHVRAALTRMQANGALIQPVSMALDDARLAAANVTGYEFRDALAECLRDAGLQVRSLDDILDGAYPHLEVMAILHERNAVRDPDGRARHAALDCARTIRADILAALASGSLDMLAYPSVRGAPVRLGEPQRGGNGLLAAVTGLPALSVPIGFTPSGIPVGLELLGAAGSEAMLIQAARVLVQGAGAGKACLSATHASNA